MNEFLTIRLKTATTQHPKVESTNLNSKVPGGSNEDSVDTHVHMAPLQVLDCDRRRSPGLIYAPTECTIQQPVFVLTRPAVRPYYDVFLSAQVYAFYVGSSLMMQRQLLFGQRLLRTIKSAASSLPVRIMHQRGLRFDSVGASGYVSIEKRPRKCCLNADTIATGRR